MVKYFNKQNSKHLILDIIFVIMGLLFCFSPETSMSTLEAITSGILIFYGIFCIITYTFSSSKISTELYQGVFYIVLGIFLSFIASLFVIGLGAILIVQGFKFIVYSSELKIILDKNWWIDFLIGALLFVFGVIIIIICNTGIATKIVSILLGIFLVLYGGFDLLLIFGFNRNYNELRKRIIIRNSDSKSNSNNNSTKPKDYDNFKDYDIK